MTAIQPRCDGRHYSLDRRAAIAVALYPELETKMTEKGKKTGKAGAGERADNETKAESGGATTLTEESLSSVTGGVAAGRLEPKKKSIVQAYPAVEYD